MRHGGGGGSGQGENGEKERRTRWMDGRIDRPSMRVFGKTGLRATRRPPKPQPMSAISTCFVRVGGGSGDDVDGGEADAGAGAWIWVRVSTKAGKCFDQSISDGLAGLDVPMILLV